jgi:hypothetical protein
MEKTLLLAPVLLLLITEAPARQKTLPMNLLVYLGSASVKEAIRVLMPTGMGTIFLHKTHPPLLFPRRLYLPGSPVSGGASRVSFRS